MRREREDTTKARERVGVEWLRSPSENNNTRGTSHFLDKKEKNSNERVK